MLRDLCRRLSAIRLSGVCHQVKRCVCSVVLLCALGATMNSTAQAQTSQLPAGGSRGGGGDIIIFDIIDSVSSGQVMLLGESEVPGIYEALVNTGESIKFALVWQMEGTDSNKKPVRLQVGLAIMF
jgi:hypothetical protein